MKRISFFPHIYRKITATVAFLGMILIIANIFSPQILEVEEEKKLQHELIFNPTSSSLHEKLAQYYLTVNAKASQREYALAQDFYQSSSPDSTNVAGIKSSPWQTWLNFVFRREKLQKEVEYWETVYNRLPDYQYASLKLAVLHYQLGEKEASRRYLESFLYQNPTHSTALSLWEKIK